MSKHLGRSLLWTRRDQISLEYFRLQQTSSGIRLAGTVLTSTDGTPLRLEYTVECDDSWVTKSVRLHLTHGDVSRELALVADDERRWWSEGRALETLAGCIDIDISLSPSTNTLPIRRLSLARGDASDVTAAWVHFPEMTVEPLPQRYERTGDLTYRYASDGGSFTADIEVDELGLVVRYPPSWERVAQG